MTLSEKMNKILEELNMTQKAFIVDVRKYYKKTSFETIGESTLKDIFRGQRDINAPNLETIKKIFNYLKESYEQFKDLSINYFLDENIDNITNTNIEINKIIGLNDQSIQKMKDINDKYNNISNDFIINTNESFWKNLEQLQIIKEYKSISKEIQSLFEEKKYNTDYFKNLLIKKLDLQDKIEHFRYIAEFDSVPSEPFQSIEDIQKIDNIINLIESNPSLEHLILNTLQTPYYENKLKYEINQDIILYLNKE